MTLIMYCMADFKGIVYEIVNSLSTACVFNDVLQGPGNTPMLFTNFAVMTTDDKIWFSGSFLLSFEWFFQEEFFGHKECFIQPNFPRAFSRWKIARRASDVYVRRWADRGVTQMTYIYVVGTERVNIFNLLIKRITWSIIFHYGLIFCTHWNSLVRFI